MRRTPSPPWLAARPIAHRGLHDKSRGVIENTRSAFAAAVAAGYAIECDVQLTADGEAVVFHDEQLERLMLGAGRVVDHTAAQMTTLALRGSADHVQTLAELLRQVGGAVPLVIELKSQWENNDALVRRALAALAGYRGPYGLMSFDPHMIETVRRLSPATLRGIVADRAFDDSYNMLSSERLLELRSLSHLGRTAPHFLSFYFRDLPFAPLTALRQMATPVISWTIRSPEQARDALRYSDQITFEGYLP